MLQNTTLPRAGVAQHDFTVEGLCNKQSKRAPWKRLTKRCIVTTQIQIFQAHEMRHVQCEIQARKS
jgi:hypothetical protein